MSDCISIVCPSCGADYGDDGWEILRENEVHQMKCEVCRAEFFVSIFECERCVADNVISSLSEQEVKNRTCRACGHRPEIEGEDYVEPCL
jgi:Zn ribbon nucleic-acid-binding protein